MTHFSTLADIQQRGIEAVIAQSGLSHLGLKAAIRALLSEGQGRLVAEPVIEAAHPFIPADTTLAQTPPDVLHPRFVQIVSGLAETDEYRFPAARKPFRHQYAAWEVLSRKAPPQSLLVTSGTGSGKTECFLFPILSDLTRQATEQSYGLEGVQAIMLYPLNALIESQKLRLSAWTKPLKGRVRYALYNGDMEQSLPASVRRDEPERVPDRETLRASPPPVLVTNITMLEYMLARIEDQPIIEKSKGKLKWIVLDEAHSLVGAAAAEIALLLRRVLLAFEVKPEEVHFVATSATIGDGEDILQRLKAFLAEIGGVRDDQVHVIEGHRQLPARPDACSPIADLEAKSPDALYNGLGGDPQVWSCIEGLLNTPQPLSAFATLARRYDLDAERFVTQLARAERRHPVTGDPERLAPLRIHAFERSVPGVWACLNPTCHSSMSEWPFGRLYSERADICPFCRAPVLEILNCFECGVPMLSGTEGRDGRLLAPGRHDDGDEFAADAAQDEATDDDDEGADPSDDKAGSVRESYLFPAAPCDGMRQVLVDLDLGRVASDPSATTRVFGAVLRDAGDRHCPCCAANPPKGDVIRPLRFGAPFMIGNAAPLLLDGLEPKSSDEPLPYGGRGLLSFTDSRQGTARMSARMQADAERNFVRSFIYHSVQNSLSTSQSDSPEAASLRGELETLEPLAATSQGVADLVKQKRERLAALAQGQMGGIAWQDMVDRLAERPETRDWIADIWAGREPEHYSQPSRLAEFLILRELERRPRRANALETLGLARLRFPAIDACERAPAAFERHGGSLQDWKDYLHAVVTHFVRANRAVHFADIHRHWLMPKQPFLKGLLPPSESRNGNKLRLSWPGAYATKGSYAGPVVMLVRGLGLDLSHPADADDLNDCLRAAWDRILMLLTDNPERRGLDFTKAFVAPVTSAYVCPDTRRLLDVAPFGLTPYARFERDIDRLKARRVAMPQHPAPKLGQYNEAEATAKIRAWLASDSSVRELRDGGQWHNISDRIAYFAQYTRSAEHSAQQPNAVLRRYEAAFKEGRINILNCSTTMEMGVDIGSVSTVMMTNVPPSIANYRQRVGRAGRRGQAISMAFTYCKDRPLDREAFSSPITYLNRRMAPPKVALTSRPIVQRHVNAYLLRAFLLERQGDALRMKIGSFMGCPSRVGDPRALLAERPVARFCEWLGLPETDRSHQTPLALLTARSVLEDEKGLLDDARNAMSDLEMRFVAEWRGFQDLAGEEGKDAKRSRMGVELTRLCDDFLLSALADRGFFPGHGFPTDVVTFIPSKPPKPVDMKDGARAFRAAGPQRSLDLAIRDYAPGSEVVLDGLVHRSAGVTLNWKRPASEEKVSEVQSLSYHWQCASCGASDSSKFLPSVCTVCGFGNVDATEYLRPSGFTVDPREKSHADTDIVTYVPAEQPQVSTRGAAWRCLPWPETGRIRMSRTGRVFYANYGPNRSKYALCLHCGRAEPEPAEGSNQVPLLDHRPLRWGKTEDRNRCDGNDNPWKVRRNLALGHEISTDTVELQLPKPMRDGAANALAIALRESLARILGIDADEMGFATHTIPGPYGSKTPSLLLFDKASGGAGFATSLPDYLPKVLRGCENVLDCTTPGCVKACAACVLTSDAPDREDALLRLEALDYLRMNLLRSSEVSPEDRILPDTCLSLSVLNEIESRLASATLPSLLVYLTKDADLLELEAWIAVPALMTWSRRGYSVTLVTNEDWLKSLNMASRMTLRDFALRAGLSLATGEQPLENAATLAVVASSTRLDVWACRNESAAEVGAGWGQAFGSVVVCGTLSNAPKIKRIGLDVLNPKPGARFAAITRAVSFPNESRGIPKSAMM